MSLILHAHHSEANNLLCVHGQEWFTVLEHYHRLTATVSDLIMGNSYLFRVFSENQVGRSENGAVTKTAATIQKTGNFIDACSIFMTLWKGFYVGIALQTGTQHLQLY